MEKRESDRMAALLPSNKRKRPADYIESIETDISDVKKSKLE